MEMPYRIALPVAVVANGALTPALASVSFCLGSTIETVAFDDSLCGASVGVERAELRACYQDSPAGGLTSQKSVMDGAEQLIFDNAGILTAVVGVPGNLDVEEYSQSSAAAMPSVHPSLHQAPDDFNAPARVGGLFGAELTSANGSLCINFSLPEWQSRASCSSPGSGSDGESDALLRCLQRHGHGARCCGPPVT